MFTDVCQFKCITVYICFSIFQNKILGKYSEGKSYINRITTKKAKAEAVQRMNK